MPISGLNINVNETKAVWIGSRRNSNEELCQELGLNWEKGFSSY